MSSSDILLQIATGVALAACCGLRAWLPLLAVGAAGRVGLVELNAAFDWIASDTSLIALGFATVLELIADKVPALDHVLDLAGLVLRPLAGALAVACVAIDLPPLVVLVIALILGAGTAGGVQASKALARWKSSLFSGTLANPALSVVEDVVAVIGTVLAIAVPLIAVTLLALGVWAALRLLRRWRRRPAAI
ncbi:MAG TPA: DUF4126 domain-containing protein [Acidobacteriota bacterium]